MNWKKKGLLLTADPDIEWMALGAGPACVDMSSLDESGNTIDVYLSGRNSKNQSLIGKVTLNLNEYKLANVYPEKVINLGELGAFDYSGTSYPHIVSNNDKKYLYYTGWFLGKDVPFVNDLGVAIQQSGSSDFERYSRATITPRLDTEPFGIGSVYVMKESDNSWKMWYTCFDRWGQKPTDAKHYYHVKYAESKDGINWDRPDIVAVTFNEANGEYVAAKPSVLFYKGYYFMWFSYRGNAYRIGLAISQDGRTWKRMDDYSGIDVSENGWDDEMICYAHVFRVGEKLYMLYCGNAYGKDGTGIAECDVAALDEVINAFTGN